MARNNAVPNTTITESTVLRAVQDARNKLTDREVFMSVGYQRLMDSLAMYVTGRTGRNDIPVAVRIIWEPVDPQNKDACITGYTDGKTAVINAAHPSTLDLPRRIDKHLCVIGRSAHEFAHCLFTDFQLMETCFETLMKGEFFPAEPKETPENALGIKGMNKMLARGKTARKVIHHIYSTIDNIIEDGYIEKSMVIMFPGDIKKGIEIKNESMFGKGYLHTIEEMKAIVRKKNKEAKATGMKKVKMDAFTAFLNALTHLSKMGFVDFGPNPKGIMADICTRIAKLAPRVRRETENSNIMARQELVLNIMLENWDLIEKILKDVEENPFDNMTDEEIEKVIIEALAMTLSGCELEHQQVGGANGSVPIKVFVELPPQSQSTQEQDGSNNQQQQRNKDEPSDQAQQPEQSDGQDGQPGGEGLQAEPDKGVNESNQGTPGQKSGQDQGQQGTQGQQPGQDQGQQGAPGQQPGQDQGQQGAQGQQSGQGQGQQGAQGQQSGQDQGQQGTQGQQSGQGQGQQGGQGQQSGQNQGQQGAQGQQSGQGQGQQGAQGQQSGQGQGQQGAQGQRSGQGQGQQGAQGQQSGQGQGQQGGQEQQSGQGQGQQGGQEQQSEQSQNSQGKQNNRFPSEGTAVASGNNNGATTNSNESGANSNTGETVNIVIRLVPPEETKQYQQQNGSEEFKKGLSQVENELAKSDGEKQIAKQLKHMLQQNAKDALNNDARATSEHWTIRVERSAVAPDKGLERYNRIWPLLRQISKNLQKEILKVLEKRRAGGKETGLAYGRRLHSRSLARPDEKYFQKNRLPCDTPRVATAIVIDESGSTDMQARDISGKNLFSNKIQAASNAALLLYDFCIALGFPCMVIGHTTGYGKNVIINSAASFQRVDHTDRYRICAMKAQGGNRDGTALNYALHELNKRPEEIKLLFILSDGLPSAYESNESGIQHLKEVAEEAKQNKVQLYAAALDEDIPSIKHIYGDNMFEMTDLSRMPKTLLGVMKRFVK